MPVGQTLAKKANNDIGYRSTMRLCGTFPELRAREERAEAHRDAGERVDPSLLAVDHANRVRHTQSGLAERLDGLDCRPAGGDDVLDEADAVAVLEGALDAIGRPVLLGL